MTVSIEEWAAAVPRRHSRRRFSGAQLTLEQADAMRAHCEDFMPFAAARTVFVREPHVDIFGGVFGSYGAIRRAPSVLVMIADTAEPDHQAMVGYTGEGAVLEATRLGLGTCWVAGFFDRRKTRALVDLAEGERVLAVSPLGEPEVRPTAGESAHADVAKVRKRKTLPEIAPGIDGGRWPMWAFAGIELARVAPSAMNRQPWSFRLEDDSVVLSVGRPGGDRAVSKRLDCGIAMLHFELGALVNGGIGGWSFLEAPDVARYTPVPAEEGADGRA